MGVAKGQGAIALYIVKGKLGVGSRFTTPSPVLTSPLSTAVSPLPLETLTPTPCPGLRFLGSLSIPQILGRSTQEQRVWCVCEAGGTRMGISHGEQPGRRNCLLLSPETQAHHQASFGFSPLSGFCCWVVFGSLRLSGNGMGGLHMQGSAPVPLQGLPPPPFLQHMCTTCKVSPFPQ